MDVLAGADKIKLPANTRVQVLSKGATGKDPWQVKNRGWSQHRQAGLRGWCDVEQGITRFGRKPEMIEPLEALSRRS